MYYSSILKTIGNTPVIRLERYSPKKGVQIFAKLEGNNPGGSVKDRIALYMILDAQKKGLLSGGKTIIEPTSGNTGIGLAFISAIYRLKFAAVMPESASPERRKLLKAYGAEIILTDGNKGTNYAIEVAGSMVKEKYNEYLMLDQFNNDANVRAHYETTGPEISHDLPHVTHFVAGMGSGGTLMGVGRRLKKHDKKIKIVGVEPNPSSKIQGLRNMSSYKPGIYNESGLDNKLNISDDGIAFELARDLYKKEGFSVGISSGAALWGAIETAKTINEGVILTLFPDRGDKYLSTPLFN